MSLTETHLAQREGLTPMVLSLATVAHLVAASGARSYDVAPVSSVVTACWACASRTGWFGPHGRFVRWAR
jgi:hypothetical protein